jgi:predicted O-methyltransferase YrrM
MLNRIYNKINLSLATQPILSYEVFNKKYCDGLITEELLSESKGKLESHYKYYVENISSASMAASLELAAFIFSVCKVKRFKRLLDVGSGFSSFIFRLYASEVDDAIVYSIDDDVLWMEKTKEYLAKNNLNTDNTSAVDAFFNSGIGDFDMILHDMNFVEVRINYVEKVLAASKVGGMVIMDDVHKPDYMVSLMSKLKNTKSTIYDLKPVTFDNFNRFALAVIKN